MKVDLLVNTIYYSAYIEKNYNTQWEKKLNHGDKENFKKLLFPFKKALSSLSITSYKKNYKDIGNPELKVCDEKKKIFSLLALRGII